MLGQFRNEIGKRAVASSCDAVADEELVAAAKKGDEPGFESLAKRHQRRIFALASVTHEFGKMPKTLSRKRSRKHSSTCRSSKGNPPSPHGQRVLPSTKP